MTKLSSFQRRTLDFYLTFKDKNLTILGIIKYNSRLYLASLGLFLLVIGWEYLMAGWTSASVGIALVIGAFARDIAAFRDRIRF
jgi:hypothetical protein